MPTRRDFLASAASTGLLAALPVDRSLPPHAGERPNAPAPPFALDDTDLSWVSRLRGTSRAVFDSPAVSEGGALFRAVLWRKQINKAFGTPIEDVTPVIVFRHMAIPMVMDDAFWEHLGIGKDLKIKDPKTDKWSVYATPTQPSGPRRPTFDSKGKIWFSEHIGQALGELDPDTGKITEYKDPFKLGGGYECYADSQDNIWVTLRSYGVLARFDQKTKKYTYFPEPFPDIMGREHPGPHGTRLGGLYPPKIEQDAQGTIWYAGIAMHTVTAFKPEGNVPNNQRAGM